MRVTFRLITLVLLLISWVGLVSGQVNDDFSDGELSNNPLWQGDVANFIVNPAFQLQLDAEAVSDTSVLVTNIPLNTGAQIVWEFWMQLDFDPSNNNNMRFYLMSDQANLKGSLNGYFIRIGENGAEDGIRLFRQQGQASSAIEILSGSVNIFPSNPVGRIRIVREANGIWSINSDATGGTSFVPEGSVEDSQITSTSYSGFFLKYSAANSSAFRFDDVIIQGQEIVDLDPPVLNSVEVIDSNSLELQFSEALEVLSAEALNNYTVQGIGNPQSAVLDADPSVVILDFATDFPANQNLVITVSGIADANGNILSTASEDFIYVVAAIAGPRDVVFNEIFADPNPTFGLPEAEYLELYNPTDEFFNLAGWTFVNTTTEKVLPDYDLGPGEYVILCNSSNADLFTGFGPVIPISSFAALANSGDSLTLRNQNDAIIDIVVYSIDWYQDIEKEEGGWSLEQINPNTPCSGSNNWIASNFPLGGTPGEANSVLDDSPDLNSPELLAVSSPNNQTLVFQFNEPLNQDVDYQDNLVVSGGISVIDFSLSPDLSELSFSLSPELEVGTSYSYILSDISDCPGNLSDPFEGAVISGFEPGPGDIQINEIFADPSPAIGLPEAEFVEFFNASEQLIDLSNCDFSGASFPPGTLIAPGEYLVALSEANQQGIPFYLTATPMTSWSSTFLTNGGRDLILSNGDGVVVDQVSYNLSWYNDPSKTDGGWSIERINPNDPCNDRSNWGASIDEMGGTPGAQNSLFDISPDLNSPELLAVSSPNNQTLVFQFNEPLNEGVDYQDNLLVSGGISVNDFSLSPDLDVLSFAVSPGLELGTSYSYILSQITDCPGNVSDPFEGDVISGFEPGPGDIQINEIFADPSPTIGLPEAEFVEFFNASEQLIDLSNCDFSGASFPPGTLIAPGDYLVALAEANQQEIPFYNTATPMTNWSSTFLTNSGRDLILTNENGVVVDQLSYDLTWYQDPSKTDGGWSIERINPNDPCSDRSNWRASINELGGTPGAQNSLFNEAPDLVPVSLNSIFVPNNQSIQLNFSEPIDEASAFGAQYEISGGLAVVDISTLNDPPTGLLLELQSAMTLGVIYSFSLTGIEDCWGNGTELTLSGEFAEPEFAAPGDLIINEILSNPYDDGDDYVEIYNRSMKNVSLNGWKIASESDGVPNQLSVITTFDYILFPGEYALLTTSIEGVANFYPNAQVDRFILMPDFPSYSNSEGVVYLLDPLEQVSDRFAYDDDLHYPLLDDLDGVSLERLDFNRPSSDRGNWLSAAEVEGYGTPGYENSQVAIAGLNSSSLSAEPEVFSPDNDGFQDVVLISYKFDTPGYTGNFSVFDDRGRLVKKLANNDLLGTSGTYTWNGFDDQSRKAEIGIYIVVAEVFSPTGETELLKTPCVLAHRLN